MDQAAILTILRAHRSELAAAGVRRLILHGSYARGTAAAGSDVDLIAEFDPDRRYSVLDHVHLQNQLSDLVGMPVDLSPADALRTSVHDHACREALLVF